MIEVKTSERFEYTTRHGTRTIPTCEILINGVRFVTDFDSESAARHAAFLVGAILQPVMASQPQPNAGYVVVEPNEQGTFGRVKRVLVKEFGWSMVSDEITHKVIGEVLK